MNEYQQNTFGQQLSPQGFFGGMLGAPLGGLIGRGIGGLLGNPGMGANIGQLAGGIGGSLLPFNMDPMTAGMQQQQLMPQGFFGNLLGQIGQPLGSAIGGAFGNAGLGGTIGGIASQLGRILPFNADPMQAQQLAQQQLAQQFAQQQLAPQGFFGNLLGQAGHPLGHMIATTIGRPGMGGAFGDIASQLGRMLPFNADPIQAAYAQQQMNQQQLMPQGFFGNLLSQVGQPLGSAIGGAFGNAGLGSTIGGIAGQLGRMLPFNVDPMQAAYAQQQQQIPQQQLAPQGFFGNLLGQIGQPLGSAIGGAFGNAGLGSSIGGIAGQLGRMLPFNIDPIQAQQLAQQQLAQQLAQQQLAPQAWLGSLLGGGIGNTGIAGNLNRFLQPGADMFGQQFGQPFGQQPSGFAGAQMAQGAQAPTIH